MNLAYRTIVIGLLFLPIRVIATNGNVSHLVNHFEELSRPSEDSIIVGDPNRWQRPASEEQEEAERQANANIIAQYFRNYLDSLATDRSNLSDMLLAGNSHSQLLPPLSEQKETTEEESIADSLPQTNPLADFILANNDTPYFTANSTSSGGGAAGSLPSNPAENDFLLAPNREHNHQNFAARVISQFGTLEQIAEKISDDPEQAANIARELKRQYLSEAGNDGLFDTRLFTEELRNALSGGGSVPPPALEFLDDIKDMDETRQQKSLGKKMPEAPREVMETVHTEINKRMGMASASNFAVSAGDEANWQLDSIWFNGIYGQSRQGLYKGSDGYSGSLYGFSLGSDFLLYDEVLIGLAYSRVFSDFKFKHSSAGDKLASNNHILSLYSQWQKPLPSVGSSVIISGIASASKGDIKTKDVRPISASVTKVAFGKYNTSSFSGELEIALHKQLSKNFAIRPSLGLRHVYYQDGSYLETGAGLHNFNFAKKSTTNTTNHLAMKLLMPQHIGQDKSVIFAIDGSVIYQHDTSPQKVKSKLVWANSFRESAAFSGRMPRYSYTIGGDILLKWQDFEFILDYDYLIRHKHQSHYSSFKLKYMF